MKNTWKYQISQTFDKVKAVGNDYCEPVKDSGVVLTTRPHLFNLQTNLKKKCDLGFSLALFGFRENER